MPAGTVVYTEIFTKGARAGLDMKLLRADWTSDASGNVNGTPSPNSYDGVAIALATKPGVATPTTYSVSFIDDQGLDLVCGLGVTRSISATEYIKAPLGAVAESQLTLNISGAGNAKQGTAWLWIR